MGTSAPYQMRQVGMVCPSHPLRLLCRERPGSLRTALPTRCAR